MAEFYIEIQATEKGEHLVHKSTCTLLPASKDAIQYLGSIASIGSAVKKASERFKLATGCSHCNTAVQTAA